MRTWLYHCFGIVTCDCTSWKQKMISLFAGNGFQEIPDMSSVFTANAFFVSQNFVTTALACLLSVVILYYFSAGVLRVHFSGKGNIPSRNKQRENENADRSLRLPKKVFFVRHGESLGNIKESAYGITADWKIPLTDRGKAQGLQAGEEIKKAAGDVPLLVYYSPYKRTRQTVEQILRSFPKEQIRLLQEEPRIREQDFGNFQDYQRMCHYKKERLEFGRFFYRFPSGESGADVYDRVSSFMESLFRVFRREREEEDYILLIVSHGLTIRVMLMRWFRWTVKEFGTLVNPRNATPIVMERNLKTRKYVLDTKSWAMLHAYSKPPQRTQVGNDQDADSDSDVESDFGHMLRRRVCRIGQRRESEPAK
mmetsp:Transcript_1914/g.2188  ORF Transcript_1914/g.2188 Transcript_1914/m.2188 type:complete len:366 (-) Transcript_1914:1724-2821(-)